jgi:hypothetical protein
MDRDLSRDKKLNVSGDKTKTKGVLSHFIRKLT